MEQVTTGQLGLNPMARLRWPAQDTAQNRPTEGQGAGVFMPQIPTRDWLELPGTLATCSLASGKAPRGHRSWCNPPVTTRKARRGGACLAPGMPAFTLREEKQLPRVLVKTGVGT